MNSSRYSKILLALVVLLSVAGAANAVTISNADAPATGAVGSSVEATFTFTELYQNPSYEEWTLEGSTNLTSVTWTVTTFNQADSQVDQNSSDGQSFAHDVRLADDVSRVEVEVSGTVPTVENWTYAPAQQFVVASFEQTRQGGTSNAIGEPAMLRPYTEDSDSARQAIDDANAAIDDAGGHDGAESKVQQAVEAYNEGNFGLAEDLANEAEETVSSSQQRSQTIQLALYGLVALLLVGGGAGGLYWYRSNKTGHRL